MKLTRELTRKIKNMKTSELEKLLTSIYDDGYAEGAKKADNNIEEVVSYDDFIASLRSDISKIKGIGPVKLNEIMAVFEKRLDIVYNESIPNNLY